jgi:hypothetical protein
MDIRTSRALRSHRLHSRALIILVDNNSMFSYHTLLFSLILLLLLGGLGTWYTYNCVHKTTPALASFSIIARVRHITAHENCSLSEPGEVTLLYP